MKKIFVLVLVLLSVLAAYLLGTGIQRASANGEDRVCVMHPEAGVYREKWVEQSSVEGHLGHGDWYCPGDPTPPPIPVPVDSRLKIFLPVAVFGYIQCQWCDIR